MRTLLQVLRCKRGGPEDDKPFSTENMPKSKEQWTELQTQDPILFGNLTQQNVDRMFRENKELQEKNTTLENQRNNLSVELDNYKKPSVVIPDKVKPTVPPIDNGNKKFGTNNLPKTTQEWEDLALDDPNLHADLRFYFNQERTSSEVNFESAQKKSRLTVQGEHPDMYLPELDENGQPKKDAEGKAILKVDSRSGEFLFNEGSKKGKLWSQIYNENPEIANNRNAPTLLMAEMERRLRADAAKVVADANPNPNPDNQVVHDGVTPPVKTTVKFDSENEKLHVQKQIGRGVYRDETHYLEEKNKGDEGIYDKNSTPQFGPKKQ